MSCRRLLPTDPLSFLSGYLRYNPPSEASFVKTVLRTGGFSRTPFSERVLHSPMLYSTYRSPVLNVCAPLAHPHPEAISFAGRRMAEFPMDPQQSKSLIQAHSADGWCLNCSAKSVFIASARPPWESSCCFALPIYSSNNQGLTRVISGFSASICFCGRKCCPSHT